MSPGWLPDACSSQHGPGRRSSALPGGWRARVWACGPSAASQGPRQQEAGLKAEQLESRALCLLSRGFVPAPRFLPLFLLFYFFHFLLLNLSQIFNPVNISATECLFYSYLKSWICCSIKSIKCPNIAQWDILDYTD